MASTLAREKRSAPRRRGCLPEGTVVYTMVAGIAFNEEFDARCSVLDRNNCGCGSEIYDIPRRLVLSIPAV